MLVIGHRGASAQAPENTPEAFRLADELGADGVELDVRRSNSGRLVVHHDPLPAGPTTAPSFAEVLDACGDRMLVNVEIKNLPSDGDFDPTMTIAADVLAELRRRGPAASSRWLVSSFSWTTISACHDQAPEIPTALLCNVLDDPTIERVAAAGHRAVHPWEGVLTGELVDRCHAAGLLVNAWTCNSARRLVELAGFGVDGVCTDGPGSALEALGRSGVSPARGAALRWGTPA